MKRILIAVLLFIACPPLIFSQVSNAKISGTVINQQNSSLQGATVTLTSVNDSSYVLKQIVKRKGEFIFNNLSWGDYNIKITHAGYKGFQSVILTLTAARPVITLPKIVLQEDQKILKAVIVTSKKPLVEQQVDRVVVNVDAMISAATDNTLEALSKSPGVSVDINDNISLNGKKNVLVLIDGRPTYMSGVDLASYLRSLPAGILEKFELIANPSSQYDAGGSAVINIVLKKNRIAGFNGGINIGYIQGIYSRNNNSININYKTRKFNLFNNLSYINEQSYNQQTFDRYFDNGSGQHTTSINQFSTYRGSANGWNGKLGIDYFAGSKTIIGLMLTVNSRPRSDNLIYKNNYKSVFDSSAKGNTIGNYKSSIQNLNFNISHKFDSIGTKVTLDLDAVFLNSDGQQHATLVSYDSASNPSSAFNRRFITPGYAHIFSAKADFTKPFAFNSEFSIGVKSSVITNDNNIEWREVNGNSYMTDYSKTNHFRYTENINAVYFNIKKNWKRFSIQSGIRVENTNVSGHQFENPVANDSAFEKHYTNLFPSIFLMKKLDSLGNHTLAVNYSRKIRRPGYQQLNPFLFYQDQYSYRTGNTMLSPFRDNYLEMRYAYKHYFSVSAAYSWVKSESYPLTEAVGNTLITRPFNFIDSRGITVVPFASYEPTKWWKLRANAVLIFLRQKGGFGDVVIDQTVRVRELEGSSEFQFGKNWSGELMAFFPGRQGFGQQTNSNVYTINAGLRTRILKGQVTLSLSVNDIFRTFYKINIQTVGINNVRAYSTKTGDTRRFGISFSYRFGKQAHARKVNHDAGGAEDEKGRAN